MYRPVKIYPFFVLSYFFGKFIVDNSQVWWEVLRLDKYVV